MPCHTSPYLAIARHSRIPRHGRHGAQRWRVTVLAVRRSEAMAPGLGAVSRSWWCAEGPCSSRGGWDEWLIDGKKWPWVVVYIWDPSFGWMIFIGESWLVERIVKLMIHHDLSISPGKPLFFSGYILRIIWRPKYYHILPNNGGELNLNGEYTVPPWTNPWLKGW